MSSSGTAPYKLVLKCEKIVLISNCPIFAPCRTIPVDTSLEKKFRTSFPILAAPLAAAMFGGALLFEFLYPDAKVPFFSTSISTLVPSLRAAAWSPIVGGIVAGLLQIPLTLFFTYALVSSDTAGSNLTVLRSCDLKIPLFPRSQNLGSSSAYVYTVATAVGLVSPATVRKSQVLSEKSGSNFANWWQIPFVLGSILGAYSSSQHSAATSTGPWMGFLGGALMLIGSRMADGCTSGHGLSGMSQLSTYSMLAVPAMFGSAIATALTLQFAGFY
jgi:uncharacterized protein